MWAAGVSYRPEIQFFHPLEELYTRVILACNVLLNFCKAVKEYFQVQSVPPDLWNPILSFSKLVQCCINLQPFSKSMLEQCIVWNSLYPQKFPNILGKDTNLLLVGMLGR